MKRQFFCFLSVIFLLAVCTRGYEFPDFGDYGLDKENYNNDLNEWDEINYDKKLRHKKTLHEIESELYGKEEKPEPEPKMGKAEKVELIKEKLVKGAHMKAFKSKKETAQGKSMSNGRSVSIAKTMKITSSKKIQSKHLSTKQSSKTQVVKKSSNHKKPSTKPSVKKQQKEKVVMKTTSIKVTSSKKLKTKKKSKTEIESKLYGKKEKPEPEPKMGKAEKVKLIKEKLVKGAHMKAFKSKKETAQGKSMSNGRSVSVAKTMKITSSEKSQSKYQSTKQGSKTLVVKKSSNHNKPSTKPSVKKQQKEKIVIKTVSVKLTGSKKLKTKKKSKTTKNKSKTIKSSQKKVKEKHQKKKASGKVKIGDIGLVGLQILMALFVILASAVIVLNSLALWTLFIDSSADKLKFNVLKSWLAILDFMSGIYMFAVIVPNVFWTIDNHFKSEDLSRLSQPHSVSSNALGVIFLFLFVASLYLTSYLALWRYSSLRNRRYVENMTVNRMRVNILICITLALIVSTFPLWLPKHFAFDYQHNIFIFWFESLGKSTLHFSVSVCFLLLIVLPMLAIIHLTIITWILTKKTTNANIGDIEYIDEEVSLTKTTSFIGIGFLLIVFPFLLVSYLYVGKIISYEKTYVAHIVLFLVFCCRSLLNVGVYTLTSVQEGGSLSKTFGHETPSNQKFMGSDEEEPMLQKSDN